VGLPISGVDDLRDGGALLASEHLDQQRLLDPSRALTGAAVSRVLGGFGKR
jgi:hypothetical protein